MHVANLCMQAQNTVREFLACDEEERRRKKDDENITEAFCHIYDCLAESCGEMWYQTWRDSAMQSIVLYLLMRAVRQQSPLPFVLIPLKTEWIPFVSYPPYLN